MVVDDFKFFLMFGLTAVLTALFLKHLDACTSDRAQRVLREVQMFQPPSKRRHIGVETVGFSVSCHLSHHGQNLPVCEPTKLGV